MLDFMTCANLCLQHLVVLLNILVQVLKAVLSDSTIVQSLSPEAYQTAMIFWRDFEKSAIDLPPEERNRFVSLSSEILVLGRRFLNESTKARQPAVIRPSELHGLKDKGMGTRLQLQAQVTQRDLVVYPDSLQAQMIMRSVPAEEPRMRVYTAAHTSTAEQIQVLERLLCARAELAQLVGQKSFADITLADKMAKSPGQNTSNLFACVFRLTIYLLYRKCAALLGHIDGPYSPFRPKCVAHSGAKEAGTFKNLLDTSYPSMG